MATVSIYPEHHDLVDELVTSSRVASPTAAADTGPLSELREAYVLAASIGIALDRATPEDTMPASKQGTRDIRDSVFLGATGAEELAHVVVLLNRPDDQPSPEEALQEQLRRISKSATDKRFELLDRYAYAGFEWLIRHRQDVASIRDLMLESMMTVSCVEVEPETEKLRDPLADLLLD